MIITLQPENYLKLFETYNNTTDSLKIKNRIIAESIPNLDYTNNC